MEDVQIHPAQMLLLAPVSVSVGFVYLLGSASHHREIAELAGLENERIRNCNVRGTRRVTFENWPLKGLAIVLLPQVSVRLRPSQVTETRGLSIKLLTQFSVRLRHGRYLGH